MTQIELDRDRAIISACKKNNSIDWEQRRYEIAKDMLAALMSNPLSSQADVIKFSEIPNLTDMQRLEMIIEANVFESVKFADALIAELKKGKE